MININTTFLTLLRAGLWEKNVDLSKCTELEFEKIHKLASEQSVEGLVASGIEHVTGIKIPQIVVLSFVGSALQIEQRNKDVNIFISWLSNKLQEDGVFFILAKGQGVAQCYERPLWRASGDVDLLLNEDNYEKAKALLMPMAEYSNEENLKKKEITLCIKNVEVELHRSMPFALSRKVDKLINEVLTGTLNKGEVRAWRLRDIDVFLPNADNDVIIVFTHFLHHFFIGGVGLRQVCDWCRLLWIYRNTIDKKLLEARIKQAGLLSEWRAFAALAVAYLGMPVETMPLYDEHYQRKGEKVMKLVLKAGNFGHSKDQCYRVRYKGLQYNIVTLWRRFVDFMGMMFIFPMDAPRFFVNYVFGKVK